MKKKRKQNKYSQRIKDGFWFRFIILAVSVLLLSLIFIYRDELKNLSKLGYTGIFIVNFVSSSTVLLPLPGTASVFIGGAVWNPVIVGIVSGLGSAVGELFGYFLGFGGRGILKKFKEQSSWIETTERYFQKSGFWTTFIFALLPLPVFDVIGVIAGAVNFPVLKFFLAILPARVLRNIIFALTGDRFLAPFT